jgi:hypothetical protein
MNLIYILLIIIFVFYLYLIKSVKTIENFYTFYLPFYNKNVNEKIQKLQQHKYNYFKYIFNYKTFKIGYTLESYNYIKLLSSLILEKTNLIKIELINYEHDYNLIKDLNNNKINLASCSSVLTNLFYQERINDSIKKDLDLLYICNTFKTYLFFIIKKELGIENFKNVTNKLRIGVLSINSSEYKSFKIIASFLKLRKNIDYVLVFKKNNNEIYDSLLSDNIQMGIIASVFPSKQLNTFFIDNYKENFIFLSIDNLATNIFKQNAYIEYESIDLNNIPSFLPKLINNTYYQRFNPDFKVFYYNNYLLTNNQNDNKSIIQILNIIRNNIVLFNKMPEFKYNKMSKYTIGFLKENVPIRPANYARKYLYDNGFYTNTDNKNCKFFVGYDNCNSESLKLNGFI